MKPIEAKVLGKQVSYPQGYTPGILVAVPRILNREMYHLYENNLPFLGLDIWHAYELSFLTEKGLPVAGLLKIIYPANSQFLVESKSLKLYLNGFNMMKYGCDAKEGVDLVLNIIRNDLSQLLNTHVLLSYFDEQKKTSHHFDFKGFKTLERLSVANNITFDVFSETPEFLKTGKTKSTKMRVVSHLLRSNCKITHQPDWGSAYIFIKGDLLPDAAGLLKYLVSIRNENHFHEEICEMIYKRLWDTFSPDELMVTCIYTRRGGIDICPVRASHEHLLPTNICNINILTDKLLRQ